MFIYFGNLWKLKCELIPTRTQIWKDHRDRPRGTLTVEDDDPAVSTAGLGVVAEANVVTLHAGRLAVVTQVHFVAAETRISWLHTSELQTTKGVMQIIASAIQNKL